MTEPHTGRLLAPAPLSRRTVVALALGVPWLAHAATPVAPGRTGPEQQAVDALHAVDEADLGRLAQLVDARRYVDHNPTRLPGFEGLKRAAEQAKAAARKTRVQRVFEDGAFVVVHAEVETAQRTDAIFDVFRFEGGRIVEHWDNAQAMGQPNPSGHTMTDGPIEVRDLARTRANKAVAKAFVTEVLMQGHLDRFPRFAAGADYRQHNPMFGDGVQAVLDGFRAAVEAGVVFKLDRIHEVLGKGNFVLVSGEGSINGTPTAFYDLFRVEAGKLAEHWDVLQEIPPVEQHLHRHGKF